jgi:hypothetical protein
VWYYPGGLTGVGWGESPFPVSVLGLPDSPFSALTAVGFPVSAAMLYEKYANFSRIKIGARHSRYTFSSPPAAFRLELFPVSRGTTFSRHFSPGRF